MISDKDKAYAISQLRIGESVADVSSSMELPFVLVKKWYDELDMKDLTILNANTTALNKIINGDIGVSEDNIDKLREKIELTSIDIVDKMKFVMNSTAIDPLEARALQLLGDTCCKLYSTVVGKVNSDLPSIDSSMFEQLNSD